MGDGVVASSVDAPANQAGHGAASSSAESADQTEFDKAKQSAMAEKPTSTAQERDKKARARAPRRPVSRRRPGGTDRTEPRRDRDRAGVIDRHPKGRTLAVPNNYDNAKVKAYKERINDPFDRGVDTVRPARHRVPDQRHSASTGQRRHGRQLRGQPWRPATGSTGGPHGRVP